MNDTAAPVLSPFTAAPAGTGGEVLVPPVPATPRRRKPWQEPERRPGKRRARSHEGRGSIRTEVGVLVTAAVVAAALGAVGYAFAGRFESTDAKATDGKGGGLKPLVVRADSVKSLFDSDDGLFPGHSADITMVVTNPNKISVIITSIGPAADGAKTVRGGTSPDDEPTRASCAGRLLLAAAPSFAVNGYASSHRVSAGAEATIVLRSAVSLHADAESTCQGMQFATKWTVSSQSA